MAYDPSWTNSASGDRLVAAASPVRLCDVSELAAAINRRRRLTYQAEQVFTSLDLQRRDRPAITHLHGRHSAL